MVTYFSRGARALGLFSALALLASGCGQQNAGDSKPEGQPVAKKGSADGGEGGDKHEGHDHAKGKKVHDHSGWWCDEHGIPEHECSMCSAKVAKEFKAKGDWCDMHDRAKSQCFICDPKLKEKYAAQYRAKYGKEPPPIEEESGKGEIKK